MQKIILDTNVIVSAMISNSYPTKILFDLVLTKSVEVCLSIYILEEYIEVFNRDKFLKFPNFKSKSDVVLAKFKDLPTYYNRNIKIDLLTYASDNKFLEFASVSIADFLITGNTTHFILSKFENSKIVTPRNYWDNFRPKMSF